MGLISILRRWRGKQPEPAEGAKVDLEPVQRLLGYHFKKPDLLTLSLTHRSYTRFDPTHSPSNERLEFLGDSVLNLVVSDQLFRDQPGIHEGELTKIRAKLVNENTLASVARRIGLNQYIRLSPEEERAGGRERASIISDALESVIAAVYLDGGIEVARDVILRAIYAHRDDIVADSAQHNYKGELLELVQGWGEDMPRYEVVEESGPDHNKIFTVTVHVLGKEEGIGHGSSKKEAEQQAAARALQRLRHRDH